MGVPATKRFPPSSAPTVAPPGVGTKALIGAGGLAFAFSVRTPAAGPPHSGPQFMMYAVELSLGKTALTARSNPVTSVTVAGPVALVALATSITKTESA